MVGRTDVAEEIVQTVFLKLWQAALSFPDIKAAYAWVYRACHNAAIDHLRLSSVQRELALEANGEPMDFPSGAPAVDLRLEQRQTLIRHLAALDDREAQILAYRVIDGMTQDEIAMLLGLSRKTIVRICQELETKLGVEGAL